MMIKEGFAAVISAFMTSPVRWYKNGSRPADDARVFDPVPGTANENRIPTGI